MVVVLSSFTTVTVDTVVAFTVVFTSLSAEFTLSTIWVMFVSVSGFGVVVVVVRGGTVVLDGFLVAGGSEITKLQ